MYEVINMAFDKGFIFGTASAAYQVEGAYNEDGKGLSIWDVFSRERSACRPIANVEHGETGDVACDHYHRYKEDVAILKKLGIKNYRFSISWTRIFPDGTGKINPAGLKFYSDLVDELLANGIEPYVTLFHWDYPYELYKKGGWLNDDSPEWFLEYTKVVVDALSDRVKNWFTINEPQCFIGLGFWTGAHAPFLKTSDRDLIIMTRNVMLAHGLAVKYIRENAKTNPKIGFAPIGPVFVPENDTPEAVEAAKKRTFGLTELNMFSVSWWSDPITLGKFPEEAYELFGDKMDIFSEEDFKTIAQPLDFYASNIYYNDFDKLVEHMGYEQGAYIGSPRTATGWPITPDVMYWAPKFLYERYGLPIIVSENGMAALDWVALDGGVHDPNRIDYMERYLNELEKASDEVPVIGYFYWSILDNYEWSCGYDMRFGLVYVDYRTQERTIKDSGYWYSDYIKKKTND